MKTPTKYHYALIDFMKRKHSIVRKIAPKLRYFISADKDAILKFSNKKAKEVFDELCSNIFEEHAYFDNSTCPFCIATNTGCGRCGYAKNRGVGCMKDDSPFSKTFDSSQKSEEIDDVFSTELFENIMTDICNKYRIENEWVC